MSKASVLRDNHPKKIFARNVDRRMHELRLNKTETCRRAKMSRSTLDAYLEGSRAAGLDAIHDLALALETTAAWLLTEHAGPDLSSHQGSSVPAPFTVDARPEGSHTLKPAGLINADAYRAEIVSLLPTLDDLELIELRAWTRGLSRARQFLKKR
jgi:transcriptional regulator with XRE-family HTH domain